MATWQIGDLRPMKTRMKKLPIPWKAVIHSPKVSFVNLASESKPLLSVHEYMGLERGRFDCFDASNDCSVSWKSKKTGVDLASISEDALAPSGEFLESRCPQNHVPQVSRMSRTPPTQPSTSMPGSSLVRRRNHGVVYPGHDNYVRFRCGGCCRFRFLCNEQLYRFLPRRTARLEPQHSPSPDHPGRCDTRLRH